MSVCSACEQFFFVRSVRRYVSIGSSNYYYTLTKIHLVNPVESVDNLLIESLMFIFRMSQKQVGIRSTLHHPAVWR